MKWIVLIFVITTISLQGINGNRSPWGYECVNSKCVKTEITKNNIDKAVSFPICRLFCGEALGTVWPKVNGKVNVNDVVRHIDIENINFIYSENSEQSELWKINKDRFLKQLRAKLESPKIKVTTGGKKLTIEIFVKDLSTKFKIDTDESYKLVGKDNNGDGYVEIRAKTFYGARHGLETLSQLIVYDDIRNEYQMIQTFEIEDEPVFKYRGFALDTSRNFFSVESIKRTIDALGMVKMNTFHWHITDSHSFPMGLKSHPELANYGAYSKYKIYSPEEIIDIVNYGKAHGVRILPEFDAPAHVGEGWEKLGLTTCFNYQPWNSYCVEPPCGQFDVTNDKLYDILENIYREMYQNFDSLDLFHMGGDEVSVSCWNSSTDVQLWMKKQGWDLSHDSFMKLWGYFQKNALERLDKTSNGTNKIILWTSKITEFPNVDLYLNKDRYIIQIWTTGHDPQIKNLLSRGYNLILSNYDALYLDCGFGGWVKDGNNWCSPYIEWQKIYSNSPSKIVGYESVNQILGAEAALWSEQADEYTLDSRLWPRVSALAERLWSDPSTPWREAESRMLMHRLRLVQNGISAERLQPEWCLLNEDECPIEH